MDQQLAKTIAHIRRQTDIKPRLGFVLGSGLASFGRKVKETASFGFSELPHFAPATVEGHPGRLILGELEGLPVAVLQGRLHAYEGLTPEQVMYPVRTLSALGVESVLVSNAAGGLKSTMKPGDFMVITDHINLTGENPLRGPNWSRGPRFVDMTQAYDAELTQTLVAALKSQRVRHSKGVYVGVMGPSYETAAEIKFYARAGGSAVGMSTVWEVLAARHIGMRVCGLSCITNLGTGLSKKKLSHEDVKEVAQKVEASFAQALCEFVRRMKKRA